jgi:hypothetical protein
MRIQEIQLKEGFVLGNILFIFFILGSDSKVGMKSVPLFLILKD